MKQRVALILMLLFSATAVAQEELHVLFVGNSYTSVNDLPQMVVQVAESMGDVVVVASNTPGGCTFSQHCLNQSMALIRQGGWDVVVLQEQSQYPSFPQSQVEQEVFPYAAQLVDSVYACNPCAEPMFYMTWGRRNGDAQNAQFFPVLGTYEGMDSMLALRYSQMATDNDASLCPVGRVWRYIRTHYPDIELYAADGSHPSMAGTYAAACAFYVMFFQKDPINVNYSADLPDAVAHRIRMAVHDVVYASIGEWQRAKPQAVVEVDTVDGLTIELHTHTRYTDSLWWDFGDGFTASQDSIVSHTYTMEGDYTIHLIASRHCMDDTIIVQVSVGDNSVSVSQVDISYISISPNPATDYVSILNTSSQDIVQLFDSKGYCLMKGRGDNVIFDISSLPSGLYLVRVGVTVYKLIKR